MTSRGVVVSDVGDGDTYQILHGVVSVVLGMVLLLIPPSGLHAFFPLISLNIVMAGTLLLLLGLRTAALRSDSLRG